MTITTKSFSTRRVSFFKKGDVCRKFTEEKVMDQCGEWDEEKKIPAALYFSIQLILSQAFLKLFITNSQQHITH